MAGLLRNIFARPSKDSVRRFYEVAEKYGYGEVAASEVYALFEDLSSLLSDGFSQIKPGLYVRTVNEDIMHVVKLQPLKGLAYTPWWGVCLTFLPHLQGSVLRWNRTPKSAKLHLWEDPFEYLHEADVADDERSKFLAINGHREQYLRETMTQMWSRLAEPIRTWFTQTRELAHVLVKTELQRKRVWRAFQHSPDPELVYAYTLSRLGRRDEARMVLDQHLASAELSSADGELLRSALSK